MERNVENVEKVERAALYIRVSTEEQAMHGYSLEAQRETLKQYAQTHNLCIVDYYQDEGKSARKPYKTRPEFMRMLHDVETGKIDLILFIKLDRWFRNVGEYYKVQEILEKYHVNWRTVLEDYDTSTAAGRLKINIMLSVAQDEADRTSERIKFVFESKVARGEVITGSTPKGFKIENKRLVHDPETADMVRDMFRYYAENGSKNATIKYMFRTYGVYIEHHNMGKMLANPIYKGEFRGNKAYCEPLIDPELFDRISAFPRTYNAGGGRVYIFSGLAVCAECGKRMHARFTPGKTPSHTGNIYYRCTTHAKYNNCTHKKTTNEKVIEQWLIENIETEIQRYLSKLDATQEKTRHSRTAENKAEIKRRLTRLKDLYVMGIIDMNEYKTDYDKYNEKLLELQDQDMNENKQKINTQSLKNFLDSAALKDYNTLDRNGKKNFWRNIIKEIRIDAQQNIDIFLL